MDTYVFSKQSRESMTFQNFENQNSLLPDFESCNMQSSNLQQSNMQPEQLAEAQSPDIGRQSMHSECASNEPADLRVTSHSPKDSDQNRTMNTAQTQNLYSAQRPPEPENEIEMFKRFLNNPQQWNMPWNNSQQHNYPSYSMQLQNEQTLDLSRRSVQEPNIPPIDLAAEGKDYPNQINRFMASWNRFPNIVPPLPENLSRTSTWNSPSNKTYSSPEHLPGTSTWSPLSNRTCPSTEYTTDRAVQNIPCSSPDSSEIPEGNFFYFKF